MLRITRGMLPATGEHPTDSNESTLPVALLLGSVVVMLAIALVVKTAGRRAI
jgi:hypothetical protein